MKKCKWHICQNETEKTYCSVKCKNKQSVQTRRKNIKEKSISYKGGQCKHCGYSKCTEALEFHHMNPNEKDFGLSAHGNTHSWEKIKQELDKCILLCANCHREEHFLTKYSSVAQR
jgi:5-methylcytosine-specific restriction endonuclease McrA